MNLGLPKKIGLVFLTEFCMESRWVDRPASKVNGSILSDQMPIAV
jgi:hypothetical protein